MGNKTYAERLIGNRINSVKELLTREELSLLDLCRLYEVSPLGMQRLLDQDEGLREQAESIKGKDHHPDHVREMLFALKEELEDMDLDKLSEELERHGLIRIPSRFCVLDPGDRLVGDYGETVKQIIKSQKAEIRHTLSFYGEDVFLREIENEKMAAYELYSLGFKGNQIMDYLRGWVKHEEVIELLIKTFKRMTPVTHTYEAYQLDKDKARSRKTGEIKKSRPVRIADKEELQRLFDAGATLKQIIMITGDQSVVIEDYRDEKQLKSKKDGKTEKGRQKEGYEFKKKDQNREMFLVYVDEKNWNLTQTELAERYGVSRTTFSKAVKEYLLRASHKEEEQYNRRVVASEAMRMDNIHSSTKKNKA